MSSHLAMIACLAIAAGAANHWAGAVPSASAKATDSNAAAPADDLQAALLGQDRALDQKVSVLFDNATLADVLKWLTRTGVNFAADSSETGAARLTMNVQNQPLRDVMLAISEAFGGRWEKKGEIYVFKRRHLGALNLDMPFVAPGEGYGAEQAKEFAERARKWAEEFRQKVEKGEIPGVQGRVFVWPHPQAEEWLKTHPEVMERFRKFMSEDWLKDLPEVGERLREFRLEPRRVLGSDLSKLMDSITPEQWAKHKAQGYLSPADLNEEQRRMLGELPFGSFTITVSMNDRTLTIKSQP